MVTGVLTLPATRMLTVRFGVRVPRVVTDRPVIGVCARLVIVGLGVLVRLQGCLPQLLSSRPTAAVASVSLRSASVPPAATASATQ